ncbi:MAG: hypothetical protein AAFN93_13245 [Bacteroidota bacterium]
MYLSIDNSTSLSTEFVRQLEQIESRYWMKYYQADAILPAYSSIIEQGMACALPNLDILSMNRIIGLGTVTPISENTLRQIIHFYEKAGSSRFFIQLPTPIVDDKTKSLLHEHGFTHHNNWSKLYREVEPLKLITNDELSIRQVSEKEADNYGQLIFMSFDWEDTRLASWLATTVGQKGYKNYIVSWKGKDIAAGALFVEGMMASMAFAGTLEPFRGKGAQRLLLKARMQDAVEHGAQFITAETGQHKEDNPVQSYLNMKKTGFRDAYLRQNWIYRF